MDDRANDDPAPAPPAGAHSALDALPWEGSRAVTERVVAACVRRRCWPGSSVAPEDAQQEAMLRLHKIAGSFDPRRGTWQSFVANVANSTAIDLDRRVHGRHGRSAMRDVLELDAVVADAARDRLGREPLSDIEHLELHLDVQSALDRLSPRDRRVADLIATNTVREIADQLGVSPSTVKRACVRIRQELTKAGLGSRTNRRGERNS